MPLSDFDRVTKEVTGLTRLQIAAVAKADNAKILVMPPPPLSVVRHVDGVRDAPEEAVKQGGVIVYDYGRIDQVVEFALTTLRELSPVDSGDYVRSHVLMIDGVVVDDLSTWKPGDEISISNSQPYTRKIEIGHKGYRAHAHVYEKTEQIIARRFGNLAKVYFVYRQAPPGEIHDWAAKSGARLASRQEWLTRQPTLVIREIA